MSASRSEGPEASLNAVAESLDTRSEEPSKCSTTAAPSCANCKTQEDSPDAAESANLKPCISCKSVQYCSRDCKKAHAKQHKKVCAQLAQEYSKTADIKMATRSAPKAGGHGKAIGKWEYDT